MQEILISTVDFGTKKISASLGKGIDNDFDIISTKNVPSKGVEKGLIVDKEKSRLSLKEVLESLSIKTNQKIENIYVGISNRGLRVTETTVKITLNKGKVRGKDINRALMKSKYNVVLLDGEEVVDSIINYYILDGKIVYEEIVGWVGAVLEVDLSVIIGPTKELMKFKDIVNENGYNFKGFVVNSIATRNVFIQGRKTMGVKVLVDIGAGTSDISIFRNGVLKYIGCIPLGGNNLTKDLSICGELPLSEAEKIKHIVSSNYENIFKDETVDDMFEVGTIKISKTLLYEVIKARIEEILGLIYSEVKNTSFCEGICSIIFYGNGITFYENISELIKSKIDFKITVADNSYLEMKDASKLTSLSMLKEVFDRIFLFDSENNEIIKKEVADVNGKREFAREDKKIGIIEKLKKIIKDYI